MIFVSWYFCINIYAWHRCQHNLTFRLKMESDKEHIRHCFLFCFHQEEKCYWYTQNYL